MRSGVAYNLLGAAFNQGAGGPRPDEAGAAGDEDAAVAPEFL